MFFRGMDKEAGSKTMNSIMQYTRAPGVMNTSINPVDLPNWRWIAAQLAESYMVFVRYSVEEVMFDPAKNNNGNQYTHVVGVVFRKVHSEEVGHGYGCVLCSEPLFVSQYAYDLV